MYGFEIYHEELIKPLFICLDLLKRGNITFYGPEVSSFKQYWRFLYMIPLVICHYTSLTAYILKLFTEGIDPFEKADMLPLWLATNQFWVETAILMMKRDKVREVIVHLGSMWRATGLNEEQLKMKNAVLKRLYYGGIVFNKVGLAISWQYLLVPLFETVVRRLIFHQDVQLQLPFACVYPFEVKDWPIYLVVYAFQVYCIFRIIYIYQGVGWLLVVLAQCLHVQFLLLQEDLVYLKPEVKGKRMSYTHMDDLKEIGTNEEISRLRLDEFVRRHQDAILLSHKLNASCNKLTFTIMLFATLIICFFAVAAKASIGAYAVNNYGAIVMIMINIFILCYCSQLLSSSSSGIAQAAANNLWYKGDLCYQCSMRFIMMRSQKPCCLTSLDFSPIGLETFNKVLKTTWSYFSLASQMYDRRD